MVWGGMKPAWAVSFSTACKDLTPYPPLPVMQALLCNGNVSVIRKSRLSLHHFK